MATWAEFARTAPEMAERGAKRLGIGYAFIATTARDGSPRVHPATPLMASGRLLAFVAVHTVKYRNLLRDNRYALHAVLGDKDEEFLIAGRAVVSDDWASRFLAASAAVKIGMTSKNDVVFEFHIERAHWAVWEGLGTPNIRRVSKRWSEGVPVGRED